jgi:hypothetical protein
MDAIYTHSPTMTYSISGYGITGRIVGRSQALDHNGRRLYRLVSLRTGLLYEVSEVLLREAR